MEITYTIQMAAKLSGVGVHTIRAWEKRYKAIVPSRDQAGHRVYSKNDIEKLALLSELCLLGYSISKIAALSNNELKEQLKTLGKSEDSIKSLEFNLVETQKFEVNFAESLTIILLALKAYKLDIVAKEISKLKIVMNPREFALEIILPIMSELGAAVARGEYSVSHEHALSAILKFHVGKIIYSFEEESENEHFTIAFAGIEQDYHEFGILMGAMIARHYQFQVYYLGPNLPADALNDAIKFLNVKYIVLGATSIVGTFGPNYLNHYLEKVLSKLPSNSQLLLGSSLSIDVSTEYRKRIHQFRSLEDFDTYLKGLK